MNQKLQDSLAEVIKFLLDWAKSTQAFIADQVPLVVREAIAYGRAYETWLEGLALLVLFIGLFNWYKAHKTNGYLDPSGEFPTINTFLGVIGSIVGGVWVLAETPDFIMAWFAPKLYLVQWATRLLIAIRQGGGV